MTRLSPADPANDQFGRRPAAESRTSRRVTPPRVVTVLVAVFMLTFWPPEAKADEAGAQVQGITDPSATALDITGLADGLRETRAISFLAKLEVKEQAERLLDDLQQFHDGESRHELTSLRERFDALLEWLVSLVLPGDPALHDQLVASRDVLWLTLSDPATFRRQALPRHSQDQGR